MVTGVCVKDALHRWVYGYYYRVKRARARVRVYARRSVVVWVLRAVNNANLTHVFAYFSFSRTCLTESVHVNWFSYSERNLGMCAFWLASILIYLSILLRNGSEGSEREKKKKKNPVRYPAVFSFAESWRKSECMPTNTLKSLEMNSPMEDENYTARKRFRHVLASSDLFLLLFVLVCTFSVTFVIVPEITCRKRLYTA